MKKSWRRLLAILMILAMILPGRLSDAVGTGPMKAEAAGDEFFNDNTDIYYYYDGVKFWYKDGTGERGMTAVTGGVDWLKRTTKTVNDVLDIRTVQGGSETDGIVDVSWNSSVITFSMDGIDTDAIKWGKSTIFFDYEVNELGELKQKTASIDFYLIRMIPEPSPDPSSVEYTGEWFRPFNTYMSDPRYFGTYYKFSDGIYEEWHAGQYTVTFVLTHPEYTAWASNCGYGDREKEEIGGECRESVATLTKNWEIRKSTIGAPAAPLIDMFNWADPTRAANDNGYIRLKTDAEVIDPTYQSWGLQYYDDAEGTWLPFDGALENLTPGTYRFRYGDDNHENVSDATEITLLAYNPQAHVVISGDAVYEGTLTASVLGQSEGDISGDSSLTYSWDSVDETGTHVDVSGFVGATGRVFTISNPNLVGHYLKVKVTSSGAFTIDEADSWAIVYVDKKAADEMGEPQTTADMKFHVDGTADDGEILLPGPGTYQYCVGNNFTLGDTSPSYIDWDTDADGMKIPVDAAYYLANQENAESRLVIYIRRAPTVTTRPSVGVPVSVQAYYEVRFQADGGVFHDGLSTLKSGFVKWGQVPADVTAYETPERANYDFAGWYTDTAHTQTYDIEMTQVTAPVELYAGWIVKPRDPLSGRILIESAAGADADGVTRIRYATGARAVFIESENARAPYDDTIETIYYSWCTVDDAAYEAGTIDWNTYDGGADRWTDWSTDPNYMPGKSDVGKRIVCRAKTEPIGSNIPRREQYVIGSAYVNKRPIRVTLTAASGTLVEKIYDGTDLADADLLSASISAAELASLPEADRSWGISVDLKPEYIENGAIFKEDEFVGPKKVTLDPDAFLFSWAHEGQPLDAEGRDPGAFYEPVIDNEPDGRINPAEQELVVKSGETLDFTVPKSHVLTEANLRAYVADKLNRELYFGKLIIKLDTEGSTSVSGTTSAGWKWAVDESGAYKFTAPGEQDRKAIFYVGVMGHDVNEDGVDEYSPIDPEDTEKRLVFEVTTNQWGVQVIEFVDSEQKKGAVTVKFADVAEDADGNRTMSFAADWTAETTGYTDETADFIYLKNHYKIHYLSDDESVATVDPNTGVVTLVSAGVATITALVDEWDMHYHATQVSCILTVEPTGVNKDDYPVSRTYTYDGTAKNLCTDPTAQVGLNTFYTLHGGVIDGDIYTIEETDAGSYKALAKLKKGYVWPVGATICGILIDETNRFTDIVVPWTIEKAPNPYDVLDLNGIEGVNPTTDANDDGKIAGPKDPVHGGNYGLTTSIPHADKLEWRPADGTDADWQPCGNFVTGLVPGTYYVRYGESEDSNYLSSEPVTITLIATRKVTFSTEQGYIKDCNKPRRRELVIYVSEGTRLSDYFVQIHADNGTTVPGEANKMPLVETPTGYYVTGWADAATGVKWSFDNNAVDGSNVHLVAEWDLIKYTISYVYYPYELRPLNDDQEGRGAAMDVKDVSVPAVLKTTYTVEDDPFTLPVPESDGYEFEGWTSPNDPLRQWTSQYGGLGLTESRMWKGKTRSVTINPARDLVPLIEGAVNNSGEIVLEGNFLERTQMPWVISPEGRLFDEEVSVELGGPAGSRIYYTIGTLGETPEDPTIDDIAYDYEIPVDEGTTTIKAIAQYPRKAPSLPMVEVFQVTLSLSYDLKGITVTPSVVTILNGSRQTGVLVYYSPMEAMEESKYHLSFEVADESIVTVRSAVRQPQYGHYSLTLASAGKVGTTTITVKETTTGESAQIKVIVSPNTRSAHVDCKGVTLNANEISLRAGAQASLGYTLKPANATDTLAEWKVISQEPDLADTEVVTVSQDGTVTALNGGKATVEVRMYRLGYASISSVTGERNSRNIVARASCTVNVEGKLGVQTILIEPKTLQLVAPMEEGQEGETAQLLAAIYPEDAPNRRVYWGVTPGIGNTYEDSQYVRVNNLKGTITATKPVDNPRVVTIVAQASNGVGGYAMAKASVTLVPAVSDIEDQDDYLTVDPDTGKQINVGRLWVASIDPYVYTGSAITPLPHVYFDKRLLTKDVDYTVAYQKNINAGIATVIVNMKGNYQGQLKRTFTIEQADIAEALVNNNSVFVAAKESSRRMQKLLPTITYNGKTLANNRDYVLAYEDANPSAYIQPGTWKITVRAKDGGNFYGETEAWEILLDPAERAASVNLAAVTATVANANAIVYTGKEQRPEVTLTYLDHGVRKPLTEGYKINYTNNINVGTATVTITPTDARTYGRKAVTFRIQQRDLLGLWGSEGRVGGNARITLNGGAVSLYWDPRVTYLKGGVKPEVGIDVEITAPSAGEDPFGVIPFEDSLVLNKDYTLAYSNKVSKQPMSGTVTIRGKGNYKGTVLINYDIAQQELGNLQLIIDDFVYVNRKDAYRKTPITLRDLDGKVLALNRDYTIIGWSHVNGSTPLPGTTITVLLRGEGPYTGTLRGSFRIISANMRLSAAKNYFVDQLSGNTITPAQFYKYYEGKPILLSKNEIELTMNGAHIPSSQYEIVGFLNNDRVGTASVILKGRGKYGGLKTITFRILKQTKK